MENDGGKERIESIQSPKWIHTGQPFHLEVNSVSTVLKKIMCTGSILMLIPHDKTSRKFGTISNLFRRKHTWNNVKKNGNSTPMPLLVLNNSEHFSKHQVHRKRKEKKSYAMHINQWHWKWEILLIIYFLYIMVPLYCSAKLLTVLELGCLLNRLDSLWQTFSC